MSKNINKMITFSPQQWAKVLELQEKNGLLSAGEAVRFAVNMTISKPAYVEAEEKRTARALRSPLDKAKAEQELKEAREATKKETQLAICASLNGELRDDGACWYEKFEMSPRKNAPVEVMDADISLMDLHPYDIKDQYRDEFGNPTDKETVIKHMEKYGRNK